MYSLYCIIIITLSLTQIHTYTYTFAVRRGEQVNEHVLIGTAGTILDWGTKLRVFDPHKITMFVLDEADVMIDTQGQQDQTIRIHK